MAWKKQQEHKQEHEMDMANLTTSQQSQLNLEAYQRDRQSWEQNNMYNLPENQMKRFKDAGLNPNLIYGQGNPGNAKEMPKYQPAKADYTKVSPSTLSPEQRSQQVQNVFSNIMAISERFNQTRMQEQQIQNLKDYVQPNMAAETLNKDWQTNKAQIEYSQKANLFGMKAATKDGKTVPSIYGDKLTSYNMQEKQLRDTQINKAKNEAIRLYLENELKRKDISAHTRREINDYLKTFRTYLPY